MQIRKPYFKDNNILAESSDWRTRSASWLAMRAGRRTQGTDFRQVYDKSVLDIEFIPQDFYCLAH